MFDNHILLKFWQKIDLKIIIILVIFLLGLVLIVYAFWLLVNLSQVNSISQPVSQDNISQKFNQPAESKELELGIINVDVTGEVNQPGVYQFHYGDLVAKAIEQAGGFSVLADQEYVVKNMNLAARLKDGDKVYIPSIKERIDKKTADTEIISDNLALSITDKLSINEASQKELETLPGIGEVKASKIIENRPFTDLNELVELKIISTSIYQEIKDLLKL